MKESFILYTSYYDILKELTDEQFGQLMRALFVYARDGEAPELPAAIKMAFAFIRDDMDRNTAKYETRCKRNRENIQRRWAKKNDDDTNVYNRIQSNTKDTNVYDGKNRIPNENENGNENGNENENGNDSLNMGEGNNNTRMSASPSPTPPEGSAEQERSEPDYVGLMELWNSEVDKAGSRMRKITRMNPARRAIVLQCYRDNGNDEDILRDVIRKAVRTDFLNGSNRRDWCGTFDWLMKPEYFQRIVEGNYDDNIIPGGKGNQPKPQDSSISRQIEEQRKQSGEPQETADERLKKQLESWVKLVDKNPRSSCRKALEEYERRGELTRLGVVWEPLLHQHHENKPKKATNCRTAQRNAQDGKQ